MRPSLVQETRSGAPWRSLAAALAVAALAACAPGAAPPTAPPAEPLPPLAPGVPRAEPSVRVGLLVDTASVSLGSAGGLELVSAGSGSVVARVPAGSTVLVTADAAGNLSYQVGQGAAQTVPGAPLLARSQGDAPVLIGGKPYRGTALVRAAGPGRVTAINQVDMEAYLLGVVPRELGPVGDTLIEAAKAQAVAARTYAIQYLGRRANLGFDVFATVQDQVYGGVEAEAPSVSRAVRETAGEILTYDGKPITAYYHSTCGGLTAAIHEVWNESPVPYLVSVADVNPSTGEAFDRRSSRFQWTQRWTVEEFERTIQQTLADSARARGITVGRLRDARVEQRTATSDRVRALRISTTGGDFVVGGDRIRWILLTPRGVPLNSSKFDIQVERDASGNPSAVVATGGGWGHGIGMCQWGAMGRDRAGQDYRTILSAYYPGAVLRDLY